MAAVTTHSSGILWWMLRGEGKCGVFAGKTVWSTPECLTGELRHYKSTLTFTFIRCTVVVHEKCNWKVCHGFDSRPFHFHVTTLGNCSHTCASVTKVLYIIWCFPNSDDALRWKGNHNTSKMFTTGFTTSHLWVVCLQIGIRTTSIAHTMHRTSIFIQELP